MPAPPARESTVPTVLRRNQTLREIDRLQEELESWSRRRRDEDVRKQYKSQLDAITAEVSGTLAAIRHEAANLGSGGITAGELYERLARTDRQLIWARHAWTFFRAPFDQRSDEVLGPVLRAADEVAWSCFKPVFDQQSATRPPAPLPCIELEYAPSTLLSTHAHVMRRPETVGALGKFFETLPIPLLRLPPSVVTSPWTLALMAHEVGHVVFEHVTPGGAFPGMFEDQLAAAVASAGGAEEDEMRWRTWATEIFADLYALLMMGTAGAWVLSQLDFGGDERMAQPRPSYPPARVRLRLLAGMATQLGLSGGPALLRRFGFDAAPAADPAVHIAEAVAHLASPRTAGSVGEIASLAARFRATDFQSAAPNAPAPVEEWTRVLLGTAEKIDAKDLRAARIVTAASVHAAIELESTPPAGEASALCRLADVTVKRIAAAATEGTRAGPQPPKPNADRSLAKRILEATDEELAGIPI